jgi:hypothetical protein
MFPEASAPFVEHCVLLVLGHPFDFSWLEVSQTDVFHHPSPFARVPGTADLQAVTRLGW